jgi:hypothetical protein
LKIPLHAAPFFRNVRRFFGGPASPAETAFEHEVLCAADVSELSPPVFLDGQLQKIFGTPAESTLDAELDHVLRRTVTNAPTIAFHIKNAVLLDGSIYAGRMRHVIGNKSAAASKEISYLDTGAICSSAAGSTYFGHWLADDALTYMLAERYGKPVCCTPNSFFGHMPLYAQIFGQDWTATDRAHVGHLILFQDFAQTSLKKRRQLELRGKVLHQFAHSADNHLVYLKRGNTGVSRPVANEQEIIDGLSRKGFTILDIRTDSLDRILSHLVSSKIVVSIEGSQTYHGAYSLPRGSGLLLLQPPGRFTATQRDWSENIGVRFGFVVGDQRENSTHFPLNDILKTVDLFFDDKV